MSNYYDRQGNPIDMMTWVQAFEDNDGKLVAQSQSGGVLVSTVWLGLDHRYSGLPEGPPLIFETMIFGGDHDEDQWRYSTEAEALEGHRRACEIAGVEV